MVTGAIISLGCNWWKNIDALPEVRCRCCESFQ